MKRFRIVGKRRQLVGRHFCENCDNRVLPYDSFERDTEAPELGASGTRILLASANTALARTDPDNPSRIAWCFACKRWTETYRLTQGDLVQRYLNRRGVEFRHRKGGTVIRLKRRSA